MRNRAAPCGVIISHHSESDRATVDLTFTMAHCGQFAGFDRKVNTVGTSRSIRTVLVMERRVVQPCASMTALLLRDASGTRCLGENHVSFPDLSVSLSS